MEVAERQRDFAGSHPVGVNLNGQTERDPRRRSGSIRVAEMGEAVPRHCAGGTPALPGGPSSTQKTGNMVYIMPRNRARRLLQASRITPPWRGSRREGGARSRAGGGQTPRPVSDYQRYLVEATILRLVGPHRPPSPPIVGKIVPEYLDCVLNMCIINAQYRHINGRDTHSALNRVVVGRANCSFGNCDHSSVILGLFRFSAENLGLETPITPRLAGISHHGLQS